MDRTLKNWVVKAPSEVTALACRIHKKTQGQGPGFLVSLAA